MERAKISVIVPVYNVSKYLRKCLDSILSQTWNNIEVIVVDDGSTDGSSIICDEYQEYDSRIRVVHKLNAGLSIARNTGLECATGDYISFVDSDDWLLPDFFEKMTSGISQNADVINCNYSIESGDKIFPQKKDNIVDGIYMGEEILNKYILPLFRNGSHMPVWTNLYSMKLIKRLNLRFVSEREVYAEDDLFNTVVYCSCNSIYKSNDASYVHLIVKGSLSQSYRHGLFKMLCHKRHLKEKYIASISRSDLLRELNSSLPNEIASCLFKESLCDFKTAKSNIQYICESAKKAYDNRLKATGKYASLYFMGKHNLYTLIIVTSKLLKKCEPIYRLFSLQSKLHK